jgi:hypothetical protein
MAQEKPESGVLSLPREVYTVIHLFQGTIHEVKAYLDWDMARKAADAKIVKEYGELVDEQCGDDEIILEGAEVVPADKGNMVLLDLGNVRQALVERMNAAGMPVPLGAELGKMVEDFCHRIDDGMSDFIDDRFKAFNEETSEGGG